MKDITIKITGKSKVDGIEQETLEFVSEGHAHMKGETLYVFYDESAIMGERGQKTIIKIKGDSLTLKRRGKGSEAYEMTFEKGLRHKTGYYTPYGDIDLEILTKDVTNEIDRETLKGRFCIDYEICFMERETDNTKLYIEIY